MRLSMEIAESVETELFSKNSPMSKSPLLMHSKNFSKFNLADTFSSKTTPRQKKPSSKPSYSLHPPNPTSKPLCTPNSHSSTTPKDATTKPLPSWILSHPRLTRLLHRKPCAELVLATSNRLSGKSTLFSVKQKNPPTNVPMPRPLEKKEKYSSSPANSTPSHPATQPPFRPQKTAMRNT